MIARGTIKTVRVCRFYAVECGRCGMRGPEADNRTAAKHEALRIGWS